MSVRAVMILAAYCVGSYLVGSVPFGYVLGRLRGVDIRRHGSRNIGATNCWRVCGWRFGLPAFALDVAKGFAAARVAATALVGLSAFQGWSEPARHLVTVLAGAAAIAGHVFPVYLGFRGGKAVATSLGVFLGIPSMALLAGGAFALWAVVFVATRYVSVASTAAALGMLAAVLTLEPKGFGFDPSGAWAVRWPLTAFTIVLAALVLYRHRDNYRRLLAGTEHRFGMRKGPVAGASSRPGRSEG